MQSLRLPCLKSNPVNFRTKRSFGTSAPSRKALPFFLDTLRAAQKPDDEHEHSKVLRLIMFGKPGSGKGTLSARLVRKYDISSISSGDLLRQQIAERSEVGRQAEEIVAQGKLLPDEIMLKVVTSELDRLRNKHWILDGFPRTLGQGELLDAHLKRQGTPLSLVVNLDVPDEVILSRISDRWIHLPSGRVYNMSYNRPRVEGFDDETGEPLTKRPDDNPETFAQRLVQFYKSASPLISYYTAASSSKAVHATRSRNRHQHPHQLAFPHRVQELKFVTLSGTTSDEIWPLLDGLVKTSFPTLKERVESRESRKRHSLSDAIIANGKFNSTAVGRD